MLDLANLRLYFHSKNKVRSQFQLSNLTPALARSDYVVTQWVSWLTELSGENIKKNCCQTVTNSAVAMSQTFVFLLHHGPSHTSCCPPSYPPALAFKLLHTSYYTSSMIRLFSRGGTKKKKTKKTAIPHFPSWCCKYH